MTSLEEFEVSLGLLPIQISLLTTLGSGIWIMNLVRV